MNILPTTKYPVFYIEILKSTLMIVQSAGYELGDNMNSLLNCLFCGNDFLIFLCVKYISCRNICI